MVDQDTLFQDTLFEDATAQASALRDGSVSSLELTTAYLDRIAALDDVLRSYVTVDRDGALAQAKAADQRRRAGGDNLPPFLGVTLSIKDVEDVAGLPTTHSCRALAGNVAAADSPIVRRFREAGFVIVGKTNVPEFCTTMTSSELNGICRNPWDLDRTPGGSSGGAGAALAAGLCAASHGTDGAGSVRGPAAFCGLVGIKPSRGLIDFGSEEGPAFFGTTVNGVLTRSVRDTAALLDVMTGNVGGPAVPEQADGPLRIAVTTAPPMGVVEPECAQAAERVGALLSSLGHPVEAATPDWNAIMAVAAGPMEVPGAAGLLEPSQFDLVEPRNRPMIEGLAGRTVVEHARWVEQVRAASRAFQEFWRRYDVLVSPTMGVVPPPLTWAPWDQNPEDHMMTFAAFPSFAQPFNLSGQPAISLPIGWSESGLPIGIQLAGRLRDEATLLRLSYQLESALPWRDRVPSALGGLSDRVQAGAARPGAA
jgi:amidase